VQNGWIFKGRRGGCPFYVYLEDEDEEGIGAVSCQLLKCDSNSKLNGLCQMSRHLI